MATTLAWLPAAAAVALAAGLAPASPPLRAEPRLFPVLNTDAVETIRDQRARDAMAADELVANLAARGYRDISAPRRKGGYYVVEAIGRRGERVTLIVDVWTGEVSGLRRRFD